MPKPLMITEQSARMILNAVICSSQHCTHKDDWVQHQLIARRLDRLYPNIIAYQSGFEYLVDRTWEECIA